MSELNMNKAVADEKKRLRKEILGIRDAMPEELRKKKSCRICQMIYDMEVYKEADVILVYVNYQSEVITMPLIEKSLMDKKRIFVPKVVGNEMEFYRINSVEELEEGYKGIMEPVSGQNFENIAVNRQSEQTIERIFNTLVLMPGAVFDKNCHRIGYGKGFYDRYLTRMSENGIGFCTAGLGYECQLVCEVPCEEHDIGMDMLITENKIYKAWRK